MRWRCHALLLLLLARAGPATRRCGGCAAATAGAAACCAGLCCAGLRLLQRCSVCRAARVQLAGLLQQPHRTRPVPSALRLLRLQVAVLRRLPVGVMPGSSINVSI